MHSCHYEFFSVRHGFLGAFINSWLFRCWFRVRICIYQGHFHLAANVARLEAFPTHQATLPMHKIQVVNIIIDHSSRWKYMWINRTRPHHHRSRPTAYQIPSQEMNGVLHYTHTHTHSRIYNVWHIYKVWYSKAHTADSLFISKQNMW